MLLLCIAASVAESAPLKPKRGKESGAAAAKSAPNDKSKAASDAAPAPTYTLRYKFLPGEVIRWNVSQQGNVETSITGSSQSAEMNTKSVKAWRIKNVETDDGPVTFESFVEDVDMTQQFSGRAPLKYNSRTDKTPPTAFSTVAKSIGVPLSRITIDRCGKVLKREHLAGQSPDRNGQVTLPLPEKAVAIGESWVIPADLEVPLPNGTVKKIKTQQKFTLESVQHGVAAIQSVTQILTPIHDPAIESQIMQNETTGVTRFDIEAGRILGQETNLDKRVLGFRGESSMCHYRTRIVEEIVTKQASDAAGPSAAAEASPAAEPKAEPKSTTAATPATKTDQPAKTPGTEKAAGSSATGSTAEPSGRREASRVKVVIPEPSETK
jgi:hypothetical protein